MKSIIELSGLSLLNKKVYRLNDVSFSIRSGEKVAILGKSGSGKTSLLKVANGTIKPTYGIVKYNGTDITKISRRQKAQVGTLWQDLRLIEELSVNQNINSGILGKRNILWSLANLIIPIEQKECIDCLIAAQLSETLIHQNVKELSSGQRRRVAIARLLRQKSNLYLADEPLTALDPNQAKRILLTLLNEFEGSSYAVPSTCIITLHQPNLIKYFTRVIGLKEGRIFFDVVAKKINPQTIQELYS